MHGRPVLPVPDGFSIQTYTGCVRFIYVAPAQCDNSERGTFCTLLTQIGAIKRIRRSTQILYGIPKINFIYDGKQLSVLSTLHRFFDFSAVTGECPTGVSIISNDKVTSLIR